MDRKRDIKSPRNIVSAIIFYLGCLFLVTMTRQITKPGRDETFSEMVREKLFLSLEQELPYSVAVQTEYWDEDPQSGMLHIGCVIYVSTKSHKAMVIGAKGRKLKEVGQAARLELEAMLGQKTYLQLWVKVKPRWTENRHFLQGLAPENQGL